MEREQSLGSQNSWGHTGLLPGLKDTFIKCGQSTPTSKDKIKIKLGTMNKGVTDMLHIDWVARQELSERGNIPPLHQHTGCARCLLKTIKGVR